MEQHRARGAVMIDFIVNNWRGILLAYVVGAIIAFLSTFCFMLWSTHTEDEEERRLIYEDTGGRVGIVAIALFAAILMALIWPGAVIIVMAVALLCWMQEKWPYLFSGMIDTDENKEEE